VAGQLTAALAAASRAAVAVVAKVEQYRPEQVDGLRTDVEQALADRDVALASAQAAAGRLEVISGETQALREALSAERRLRQLLEQPRTDSAAQDA
jgi:hypothetical protein